MLDAKGWDRLGRASSCLHGSYLLSVRCLTLEPPKSVGAPGRTLRGRLVSWPALLDETVPCGDGDAAQVIIGECAPAQRVLQHLVEAFTVTDQSAYVGDNVSARRG
jgi:hypothetical protein